MLKFVSIENLMSNNNNYYNINMNHTQKSLLFKQNKKMDCVFNIN